MRLKMKLKKTAKIISQKSPTILSVLAGIGVLATVYSTIKDKEKADDLLCDAYSWNFGSDGKPEPLTKSEEFLIVLPAYIPTIAIASATIGCIFGANMLNKHQQATLLSAYELMRQEYTAYRDKVIELHGEEEDKKIIGEIYRKNANFHRLGLDTPDTKMTFLEPLTGTIIEAYEREIMDAEYHFNRNFALRGYATISELLDFLGIEASPEYEELGWTVFDTYLDGMVWIDFEHRLEVQNGKDVYIIDTMIPPEPLQISYL